MLRSLAQLRDQVLEALVRNAEAAGRVLGSTPEVRVIEISGNASFVRKRETNGNGNGKRLHVWNGKRWERHLLAESEE